MWPVSSVLCTSPDHRCPVDFDAPRPNPPVDSSDNSDQLLSVSLAAARHKHRHTYTS
ncbi:hypothetical protein WH47_03723 [Habropoda laboriosa]|uniref:Uncharacterized protein n=1 Tax=Habropoda laboriosa TaxID=597456 RepID=A0A0L7QW20_9HYME|nr:hypothetical protein WH47_03723 [Habropoda laboriosa]